MRTSKISGVKVAKGIFDAGNSIRKDDILSNRIIKLQHRIQGCVLGRWKIPEGDSPADLILPLGIVLRLPDGPDAIDLTMEEEEDWVVGRAVKFVEVAADKLVCCWVHTGVEFGAERGIVGSGQELLHGFVGHES